MYRLLLPLPENTERHLSASDVTLGVAWARLLRAVWASIERRLGLRPADLPPR